MEVHGGVVQNHFCARAQNIDSNSVPIDHLPICHVDGRGNAQIVVSILDVRFHLLRQNVFDELSARIGFVNQIQAHLDVVRVEFVSNRVVNNP